MMHALTRGHLTVAVAAAVAVVGSTRTKNYAFASALPAKKTHPQRMIIAKPDSFAFKLKAFQNGGQDKMLVIADFDYTLTSYYQADGKQASSCHGLLERSNLLEPIFHQKARDLFAHYYPIEISPALSHDEKLPYMIEWWTKTHQLYIDFGFRQEYISKAANITKLPFRKGLTTLFSQLAEHQVPTLIFSAGLADVIKEVLVCNKGHDILTPNLHIISNLMTFDNKGVLKGFEGEPLHVYNKKASVLRGSEFLKQCKKRENVLLLGDSIGDAEMAEGLDYKEIIKIGFLNTHVDERLDEYLETFDVVLIGDCSLSAAQMVINASFR